LVVNFIFLIAIFGCVLVINRAFAWTEPSNTPPAGNVEAPLNVSSNNQSKTGSLGLRGIDPGNSYGLGVGIGTSGAIRTKNNSNGSEVNINTVSRGAYVTANKSGYSGYYSSISGSNSYGGYFLNSDLSGTGMFAYSLFLGANIYGKGTGMNLGADKMAMQAKLYKDNKPASITQLNFFKNSDTQTEPVALGAYNYSAPTYKVLNSAVELGLNDIGIKAQGNTWAGSFQGNVEINGMLNVSSGCNGCGDLAEAITMSDPVAGGDIVAVDDNLNLIKATSKNKTVVGVVSTAPSMTLNNASEINGAPVALSGIVPVKVTNENGPIEAGDFITASSRSGYGMKAVSAGTVVGKALENLREASGTVKIFVSLGWFGGTCGD